MSPALAIHGGAGAFRVTSNRSLSRYREGLFRACEAGYTRLLGSNALEAVEASIRWMEDSGLFNAGIGSHLTIGGKVEMDAAIMDGRTLQAGAVGAVPRVKNPISLARRVMEETDHVLLVGEGALRFSRLLGLEETDEFLTEEKLKRHEAVKESWSKGEAYTWLRRLPQLTKRFPQLLGTVGAVAVDERGDLAAGVSTGGYWLKLEGRVADSAIVGAGLYADNACGAASATGVGEAIIKLGLSKEVCGKMREGLEAQDACATAVDTMSGRAGRNTAGVVAIDAGGRVGSAFNTPGMGRAYMTRELPKPIVTVMSNELL